MNKDIQDIYTFNKIGGTPVNDSYENLRDAVGLVQEEVKETIEAIRDDDKVGVLDGISDTMVTIIGVAYRMGLTAEQVEDALFSVNKSNLSKFDNTVEIAQESVKAYEGDERYEDVTYERVGDNYRIIGKVSDTGARKILKSKDTVKPERYLEEILNGKPMDKEFW